MGICCFRSIASRQAELCHRSCRACGHVGRGAVGVGDVHTSWQRSERPLGWYDEFHGRNHHHRSFFSSGSWAGGGGVGGQEPPNVKTGRVHSLLVLAETRAGGIRSFWGCSCRVADLELENLQWFKSCINTCRIWEVTYFYPILPISTSERLMQTVPTSK